MKEISLQFLDCLKRYLFFAAVYIHVTFSTFEDVMYAARHLLLHMLHITVLAFGLY